MSTQAIVQIIGAPVGACGGEIKDGWRKVAAWAGDQLIRQFGPDVSIEYFDLLDPACPPLPAGARLPLVLLNGEIVTNGGKVSIPVIRQRLAAIGLCPI